MGEALVLATIGLLKANAEMITKLVEGQTAEQKAQIWAWFLADAERWRKWLHLPDVAPTIPGK